MKRRLHPGWLVALVLILCAGLAGGLLLWRSRTAARPADLLRYFPDEGGLTVGIDVAALRDAGVLRALESSGVGEERDYQAFVQETGFNYEEDLDYVLARFVRGQAYFLLKGRFDWPALRRYAHNQGGSCRNTYCSMPASQPNRLISYFPLRPNVLAMAAGSDAGLAWGLTRKSGSGGAAVPDGLIWARLRPADLKEASMPNALRQLLEAAEGAEELEFSLGTASSGLQVTMAAACRAPEEAVSLGGQLEAATRILRTLPEAPGANDEGLIGVLAGGVFRTEGSKVFGTWPVSRAFAESILGFSR